MLLGDAVHSVKPYFGLGVNAAFEDVAALGDALDGAPSVGAALRTFSRKRAAEARVLVSLSRSLDRSGVRAFLSICHEAAEEAAAADRSTSAAGERSDAFASALREGVLSRVRASLAPPSLPLATQWRVRVSTTSSS